MVFRQTRIVENSGHRGVLRYRFADFHRVIFGFWSTSTKEVSGLFAVTVPCDIFRSASNIRECLSQ